MKNLFLFIALLGTALVAGAQEKKPSGGGTNLFFRPLSVSVISTTNRPAGSNAVASVTGTNTLQFSFGIPVGRDGTNGGNGATGATGPQGPQGPEGPAGSSGITDAPNDGTQYARQNTGWSVVTNYVDAPMDDAIYARSNGQWVAIATTPPALAITGGLGNVIYFAKAGQVPTMNLSVYIMVGGSPDPSSDTYLFTTSFLNNVRVDNNNLYGCNGLTIYAVILDGSSNPTSIICTPTVWSTE